MVCAQGTNLDLRVRCAVATNQCNEVSGEVAVRLVRVGTDTNAFSVDYVIEPGTAQPSLDYTAATGTVNFAQGQNSSSFTIPILDDAITEDGETFVVRLTNPSNGAALQEPAATTITIADNDRPGGVDPSFNPPLAGSEQPECLGLQSDGSVVLLRRPAYLDPPNVRRIFRLTWDGQWDKSFSRRGDASLRFVIDSLDRIISIESGGRLTRLRPDGSLDQTFGVAVNPQSILDVCALSDGAIVFSGGFTNVNGQRRQGLARVSSDARLLPEPSVVLAGPDTFPWVRTLAPCADGSLLIAGTFTSINGLAMNGLAKVTPQGAVATGFVAYSGSNVTALASMADGRILVGGNFTSWAGEDCKALVCLLPDGRLDTNFASGSRDILTYEGGAPRTAATVKQILVDTDQKIYVLGSFTHASGKPRQGLARLLPEGKLDEAFDPGSLGRLNTMEIMALGGDGTLTVGGRLDSVDSAPRTNIVRLFTKVPVRMPRVAISSIQRDGGAVSVGAVCNRPMQMRLETSTNLLDWEVAGESTPSATKVRWVDIPQPGDRRFYRVRGTCGEAAN